MTKTNSMDLLDALADEAARYEVEEGTPTAHSRRAAVRLRGAIDDRLAALRRRDLEHMGTVLVERRPIRPDLRTLVREKLVDRLLGLELRRPALGFAYRNLTNVSDDDLRTMIEDAEAELEAGS